MASMALMASLRKLLDQVRRKKKLSPPEGSTLALLGPGKRFGQASSTCRWMVSAHQCCLPVGEPVGHIAMKSTGLLLRETDHQRKRWPGASSPRNRDSNDLPALLAVTKSRRWQSTGPNTVTLSGRRTWSSDKTVASSLWKRGAGALDLLTKTYGARKELRSPQPVPSSAEEASWRNTSSLCRAVATSFTSPRGTPDTLMVIEPGTAMAREPKDRAMSNADVEQFSGTSIGARGKNLRDLIAVPPVTHNRPGLTNQGE